MTYLFPNQIIYLYKKIVEQSGGSFGLRDKGLLESAVYRPQASFGGHELYPDLFSKAAALGFSLIKNHPFVDGNKRVGYAAMRLFLQLNGVDIKATLQDKMVLVLEIANGKLKEDQISEWLQKNNQPLL